jgi:hypothetical protein
VRNRSTQEINDGVTIEDRHRHEKHFFSTCAPWTDLKKDRVGIFSLKKFLGGLLYTHICNEFPGVVKDIEQLSSTTQNELELLGPSRQTSADQRRFLTRLATTYQQDVANALSGNYDPELDVRSSLKLRMHVRTLNDEFAANMASEGHTKIFQTVTGGIDEEFARSSGDQGDILEWIREIYRDSRGAELPGTVNPVVLENMFRQQSSKWRDIATTYMEQVNDAVHKFNKENLERRIPDNDVKERLKSKLSQGEKTTDTDAREQLSKILNDERGGILQTVNSFYADTREKIRKERVLARLKATGLHDGALFNTTQVMKSVHLSIENQSVNDIHDVLKAYYKVAMKRFTDNVVLQVTERHILGLKGPIKILSPDTIGTFSDNELQEIAGENFATSSARNELVAKHERFQKALEIARQAVF